MADIKLINLVTQKLVNQKQIVEYNLSTETVSGDPDSVIKLLREYSNIINDIKLWESLINDINPNEGENKNQEK